MIQSINDFKRIYNQFNNNTVDIFLHHFYHEFVDVDFKKKKILEIWCSKGFTSLMLACVNQSTHITAIDEYGGMGGDRENYYFFKKILVENKVNNIMLRKMDFLENDFHEDEFDIIIANNALHHIVRTGRYISNDLATKNEWVTLFRELRRLLRPNGIFVIGEFSRKSIWRYIKLRYKQIDWWLHPTLKEWLLVIRLAGVPKISFKYTVPYKLRKFESLFSNALFSFFINPSFNIYAQK